MTDLDISGSLSTGVTAAVTLGVADVVLKRMNNLGKIPGQRKKKRRKK